HDGGAADSILLGDSCLDPRVSRVSSKIPEPVTRTSLSHYKLFNRVQLPASAHARQDVDGRARLFHAQLFRVECYIQGQVICVELLAAQHVRLPAFRLRAHRATNKLYQLARHNQGRDLRLTAAAN